MHEPNTGLQYFLGLVWDLSSLIQTFATFPNFSWRNLTTTNLTKHLQPIQSFPNLSPHIFASPQIYQPLTTFPHFLLTSHNINQPWYPRLIQLIHHPTSPNQPLPTILNFTKPNQTSPSDTSLTSTSANLSQPFSTNNTQSHQTSPNHLNLSQPLSTSQRQRGGNKEHYL
jgi:hypothetical protein